MLERKNGLADRLDVKGLQNLVEAGGTSLRLVFVAACHGLLERDGGGWSGKSDPFVVVKDPRGKEILKTPRVDDCVDPDWREMASKCTAEATMSAATPGAVTFEVWNHNKLRNDFLGLAQLKVVDLFAAGDTTHAIKLQPRPKEGDSEVLENTMQQNFKDGNH